MSETITVGLDQRAYDIHVGAGFLARAGALLKPLVSKNGLGGVVPVVTDSHVTPIFALAPRIEWFSDPDAASIPVGTLPAGIRPKVKEFTMTGEFKAKEGILMRLEYRRDWSNANLFYHGNDPFSSKNQTTLVAGFVAFFGPKR